jgi:hypothetical protein
MLENVIIGIIGLCVNMGVGATVWSLMDNEEGALKAWFDSTPQWCAWFMKPLILSMWFLWLMVYIKGAYSGYIDHE